jgi:Tfp pilus tip-associated adhesin PilY1
MKRTSPTGSMFKKIGLVLAIGFASGSVNAALTDIAGSPMANTASSVVKPNVMFLLDGSGSMDWDFMPDALGGGVAGAIDENLCKGTSSSNLSTCNLSSNPARASAQVNGIYYNPTITYTPPVKYDGTSYTSYTTWTAVPNDGFGIQFTGTTDLTLNYLDTVYCNTGSPSTADKSPPFTGGCKQEIQGGVWAYPNGTYNQPFTVAGTNPPYYYTIANGTNPPVMWCSTASGTNGGFGTGTCQVKETATFQYPKYGPAGNNGFTRTEIKPSITSYPRSASRTDCTGAVGATGCTYAQEMTNFANWYAYYRTRMQMMKTAAGLAFKQVTDSFRVGLITINPGSPVSSTYFLPVSDFTAGAGNQKDKFYTKFYAQNPGLTTPLREALSRVGRYYAHVTTGINNGITDDPVQYSCQQNFTIMSTDGYWNGNAGQDVSGNPVGNMDASVATAPRPMLDGSAQISTATSNNTLTQQICTGSATVFGATPCGCPANTKRVKQQTSSSISTVVSRDGVVLSTTPSSATTYQDITSCDAVVTTAVTPTTKVDEQMLNGGAMSTFASVNGISAGANQAGSCAANFGRIKRRTTTATSTVVTTGGVAAAPVLDATYAFTDVGSCVALTNTVVSHFTIVEQQMLNGNASSTFATVNGLAAGANQTGTCAANNGNIKQRTTQYDQTVITVGGTAGAPSFTNTTYTFTNGACSGLTLTTVTPVTRDEEQKVVGNAVSTFGAINGVAAGANQAGLCAAGQDGILHRRTTYNSTVTTVGSGGPTSGTNSTTYSFSPTGACVAQAVSTAVTPTTIVEEQIVIGNAASTFAAVNGVAAGANQAGTCVSPQKRIKRRTTTYNTTVTTTDGVTAAPVTSGTAYSFTDVGSCVLPQVTTTTTPVTETAQSVCINNNNTSFAAPANGGANTQTACTCGAGSGQTALKQRVVGYTKTQVTTDGVAAAATYSAYTSGPTFTTPTGCSGSAKTAAATVFGGSPTVTTTGGPTPVPAATTNTTGSTTTTSTGGPVPVAGATTSVNGTPSSTTTGGPTPAATTNNNSVTSNNTTGGPSPAASTSSTGSATSTSTGGTVNGLSFTIAPPSPPSAAATTAGPASTQTINQTSGPGGYADTLADVAQYYYITDLRPNGSLGAAVGSPATQLDVGTTNNVPGQPGTDPQNDSASWQHMTTITLGLGVDGTLNYDANYRSTPTGDFLAIKNGTKNWPQPVQNTQTAVDDLWHAAVDGRGTYFSAKDPAQLVTGLTNALVGVQATTGSAAAAATSNLEPVAGDNFAYVASYTTVRWNGDVEARTIDLNTGAVSPTGLWSAQAQLDTLASATTPGGQNRLIKRFKSSTSNKLQDFTWANLTATEQNYFSASWISTGAAALSQWGSLTAAQQTAAAGLNLVNFIRGDSSNESQSSVAASNQLYADRQHVLGDIVNGAPVYVRQVSPSYTDAGYASPAGANFKECVNTGGAGCSGIFNGPRTAMVYVAANDGMLHALDGNTGVEQWAFIPSIVMPNLYRLADKNYANIHQWYVDGSPTVGDIYDPVAAKWKTILVGGLGGGGRSYYALDITDPANPKGLWEFNVRATASCPTTTLVGDTDDCDLGYTFGNPIITKLGNGTWVVVLTSGYNNVSPGNGQAYVYVLNPVTGGVMKKIQAANSGSGQFLPNPGSTTTPQGLSKLNNWVDDTNVNNTTLRVYGGDLLGYLWRINLDATPPSSSATLDGTSGAAIAITRFKDSSTSHLPQPVTTKPELGEVSGIAMIYVGTGRYLGTSDLPTTQVQTIYGIKDITNGVAPASMINTRATTPVLITQTLTDVTTSTGAGIRTATSNAVDLTSKSGWLVDLPDLGERVNVDPKLQLGTLIVGSNIPASSACVSGGTSYLNFLDYKTGGFVQSSGNTLAGVFVGNSLVVGVSVVRLGSGETTNQSTGSGGAGKTVAIVTTSDNKYPNLAPPFSIPPATGRRDSWRELNP